MAKGEFGNLATVNQLSIHSIFFGSLAVWKVRFFRLAEGMKTWFGDPVKQKLNTETHSK